MDWKRGRLIGRGSSATVSIATSSLSGDIFAVKSAELSRSEALKREQKILPSLNSPHVVSYIGHDITRENSTLMYNLLLEYGSGGTLSDAVRGKKRLDEPTIGGYTRKIVQGLEYLHSMGLVHCDIKGANILLCDKGPKIADFGCARGADAPDAERPISGTPMYMAPEAARGEKQDFASDIWSLGCTVIEMASGNSPWANLVADPVTVLYRIAYSGEVPEFPSFLSEKAKDFLGKCLRRNPEERWTACQLLKHPFLTEVIEFDSSSSPTSILDQGIWNSLEESSESLSSLEATRSGNWGVERIRKLALFSEEVTWSSEQSWVTIRSGDYELNNVLIGDYGDSVGGSGRDLDTFCCCCSRRSNYGDEIGEEEILVVPLNCRGTSVVNLICKDRGDLFVNPLTTTILKS